MPHDVLLEHILALGDAFKRRGMDEHVRRLRLYFLAVRHGLTKGRRELDVKWSEAHLVAWMQTLQVPPYERALELRKPGGGCPSCGAGQGTVPSVQTELVFPGGARMACRGCGRLWLELEPSAAAE